MTEERTQTQSSLPRDEAACAWFVRLRGHQPDQQTLRDFALWLEEPLNRRAFDAVAATFEGAADVPLPREDTAPNRRWFLGAVAAAIATVTVLLSVQWNGAMHQTAVGEQLAVQLEDGSEVVLNTDSALRVAYRESTRDVHLNRGEAWFKVRSAPDQPFTVHAAGTTVTALGTMFTVHDRGDAVLVAVSEGRVRVSGHGQVTELDAGNGATVVSGGTDTYTVRPEKVGSWRDQLLVYEGIPLRELVEDLNRYLPATMTVTDTDLAALEVSAVLRISDQNVMLDALSTSLPLRWKHVSDELILIYPGRQPG